MEPTPMDDLQDCMSCFVLYDKSHFVLFYRANFDNIITNTFTKIYVSATLMFTNAWNLLPAWISKPQR